MRLIAKAALGALALASLATASASAQSYSVHVGPGGVAIEPRDPCLRAPAFRPAYCFRHDWRDRYAFNDRGHMWREHMRERHAYLDRHRWMTPDERQAYLDRRYWDMTH